MDWAAHRPVRQRIHQIVAVGRRQRHHVIVVFRVAIQRVNELGGRQRQGQSRQESRALHELFRESVFVVFELLLPVALIDDHALTDALGVRQKLIEPNDWDLQSVRPAG